MVNTFTNTRLKMFIFSFLLIPFLWSQNINARYGEEGLPKKELSKYRFNNSRSEQFELYMVDAFEDSWNGASVDLYVNGTLVLEDATVEEDFNSLFFDVNSGDEITTFWTEGSYDEECYYGIYNNVGGLVAEAGTDDFPDLELSYTVGNLEECSLTEYIVTVDGGNYHNEVYWEFENTNFQTVASGFAPITIEDGFVICLEDGSYGVLMNDSFGDGWNGNVLQLWTIDADGNYIEAFSSTLESGDYGVAQLNVGDGEFNNLLGCTDPTASNLNEDAIWDDGSCNFEGQDCSTALTAVEGSNEAMSAPLWYTFTASLTGTATISSVGGGVDTQVYGYSGTCDALEQVGFGDDEGGSPEWSSIMTFNIIEGTSYYIQWTDYWSSEGFIWTLDESLPSPSNFYAEAGLEKTFLYWDPVFDLNRSYNFNQRYEGTINEYLDHIQNKLNNARVENLNAWQGRTLQELQDHVSSYNRPNSRNTEVYVSLYDSYGDGHDGDAYILMLTEEGGTSDITFGATGYNILEVMSGGWIGYESSYGPFNLDDNVYFIAWSPDASYLGEQSFIVRDLDGTELAAGDYNTGDPNCFSIGDNNGDCPTPDVAFVNASYNAFTGMATANIQNIGDQGAGNFWVALSVDDNDINALVQGAQVLDVINPGDFAEVTFDVGVTVPAWLGGFDGEDHDLYFIVDPFDELIGENQDNNYGSLTISNSSPLEDVTWNIYRDEVLVDNVSANWYPGMETYMAIDYVPESDIEYCYSVTQITNEIESASSSVSCATPVSLPDMIAPTYLTGSVSGYDINLNWEFDSGDGHDGGHGSVVFGSGSQGRQGGNTIEDAVVITQIPAVLSGTTNGYENNTDEVCPYDGSDAPDVVYSFTPTEGTVVDLSLCYSSYDTKLYVYDGNGNLVACNDDAIEYPAEDCFTWTSFIPDLALSVGETYYIVIDGYGGDYGDYVLDIEPFSPHQGFTILKEGVPVGTARPDDKSWSTLHWASENTDIEFSVVANYLYPDINELLFSEPSNTTVVSLTIDDNPNSLNAEVFANNVELNWEQPLSENLQLELALDDGTIWSSWWYAGAVANRYRVDGEYTINAIANQIWMGNWPDDIYGETPYKLSILALDPETDLPGEVLFEQYVTVDAEPESENYGWGMVELFEPLTVSGDVFVMYSDFGYDWSAGYDGSYDMDMMGCDAIRNHQNNSYVNFSAPGQEPAWMLSNGQFAGCGDWILRMNVDFSSGDGATLSNWINPSGGPELSLDVPTLNPEQSVNSKENPVRHNTAFVDPVWPQTVLSRDVMGYNIYRNDNIISETTGLYYQDNYLDWGSYSYHVTALYDDYESDPSNSVNVTLENDPPVGATLLSPADGIVYTADELNLNAEILFSSTQSVDENNDIVEYMFEASAQIGEETYNIASESLGQNSMYNGSFDGEIYPQDNGWQYHAEGWETYPDANHYTVIIDGENVNNSEATYSLFDGNQAAKMWGNGGENNLFQTWYGELEPGTTIMANAMFYQAVDDHIGEDAQMFLVAKYFYDGWAWAGMDMSLPFTINDPMDSWQPRSLIGQVPEGVEIVQIGMMYVGGGGAVVIDDVNVNFPITDPLFFVDMGTLAQPAMDSDLESITWTWDIWASDGWDAVSSENGPFSLTVDLDIAYPTLTTDPVSIDFGMVENGDLLSSSITLGNSSEEGYLSYDLDLVQSYDRGSNSMYIADRGKIGHHRSEEGSSRSNQTPNLSEFGSNNEILSGNVSVLDLNDSTNVGVINSTGVSSVGDMVYTVDHFENRITRIDLSYDPETAIVEDHEFTILFGGGIFDSECSVTLSKVNYDPVTNSEIGVEEILDGMVYELNGTNITLFDGNYRLEMVDSYGDGWNGAIFALINPENGEIYWETTQLSTDTPAYDVMFNVGNTQYTVLVNDNQMRHHFGVMYPYSLTFDGSHLWTTCLTSDEAGIAIAMGLGVDNYGGNLSYVGSFPTPSGDLNGITWDGYALLMRQSWYEFAPLYVVDFDGSIMAEWPAAEPFNSHDIAWDDNYGLYSLTVDYDGENDTYHENIYEMYPGDDGQFYLSEDVVSTGYGQNATFGNQLGYVTWSYALDINNGNLHTAPWEVPYSYSYDFSDYENFPVFSQMGGIIAPGEIEIIDFNINADRPEFNYDIMVYSNDPNAVDAHIPVSYTVEPATISVDPVSISAEPLVTGESSSYQISIANTGGFDLDYEIDILFPDLVEQSSSIGMVYNKQNSSSMALFGPIENRSSGMGQNNQSQTQSRDGHEVVIFDGMSVPDYFEEFAWGGADFYISGNTGYDEGTNSLIFIQGDSWSGGGFNIFDEGLDLVHLWENNGRLSFDMWSEPNAPTVRFQFESGSDGKMGFWLTAHEEGGWHEYHINLNDFQYVDGTNNFEAHHVNVFQVMAEGNGVNGRTFHIDNVYIEEGDQPWLSQTGGDEFGTVEFGAEPDLAEFTLVADNLASGDYQGDIVIHSNDPANPSVTVPVTVSITALPIAETSTGMVDFGYVRIGSESTLDFQIWNAGMEVLEISNIVLDDARGTFSTDMVSMSINPGEEVQVLVSADPTDPDMYAGSVMFDTNDPNAPNMTVELHAIGEEGPVMVVNPSEIGANLLSYDEATQVLSVENNGPLPLEFDLDLDVGGQDVQEPLVNFAKDDYADWTLAENQDRVTEQVWITRADNQGLFNAYTEDGYNGEGPSDTYWVWGEITWEGFENGEYEWDSWKNAVESSGYNVNQALVEQLDGTPIMGLGVFNDDGNPTVYNVTWESFTGSNSGGGFSYSREHVGTWIDGESNNQQWITITNIDGSDIDGDGSSYSDLYFTKEDWADWSLAENQDRIKDDIWITRGDERPLFNAYNQNPGDAYSPSGTQWAIGDFSSDMNNLEWFGGEDGFFLMHIIGFGMGIGNAMNDEIIPNEIPVMMYLENYDEYYEIRFTSWTSNAMGGGFSYIRTSETGDEVTVNIVEPNEIAFFNVNLNSGNLDEGSYHATIHVSGNDVLNPHVAVDVTMNVSGFAEIGLSDNAIDFGEIYYGESAYQEINIYNYGTSVLVLDAMNDVSEFELSETYFEIGPGDSVDLGVEFIPSGAGEYSDRITIMTNDENNPELSVSLMGVGVAAPIITVSTDSIGAYVPEGDVRTRVFEISNSGESDLFWSIGAPGSDDMRHSIGGLQDYRDQWYASMIQLSGTNQIGNPINDNDSRSRISGHSENLGRENRNMLAKNESRSKDRNVSANKSSKTTTFSKDSKISSARSENQDGQVQSLTSRSILPPEAHTSRDGHTKIMILPSQYYDQIWSAMDAISYHYGNYDVILLPLVDDTGDTLIYDNEMIQDSIVSHNPDIILVTYNSALWEYDLWLQNELGEYAQNGGHVIYLAVPSEYIGRGLSSGNNWICCDGSIESGPETYNEENPLMMGVGSEYDYIWSYGYGLEDSQFISVLDSAYLPDNKTMILHEDVGGGKITVLGAGYYEWTDDEAIVLANAVSSQTGLVEFEPNNGVVPAGNSLTVTASFNAEIMEKGIYLNHVGIQSNDIVTPVVDMAVGMYVTGDPEIMMLSENPGMSMSGNELNFGLVPFMTESHVDLMIMNYDSLSMTMSSSFQNDDLVFSIVSGNDMTIPSFDHGMMTLSAQAGLDEMSVTNMLMMETSTSNMEMFVHANMVPRFESIITDISDVDLDQGGWVTVEFTRSFFDGEFGDFGRTEMYTVEINYEGEWTAANSSVAYEDHRYSTLVHTTQDSGSMGDGMTAFRVVAGMDEGTFVGEEAYGYSTDDMAPEVPTGLLTAQTGSDISLSWDAPVVEDFNYFSVYRSESENFETGEDNLIGYTTELAFVDTGATWFTTLYYRLTATDFAGNVGDASDAVEAYVHVNFAPTLSEVDPQSMDEDASYELVLSAIDQNEGDVLTYAVTSSSSDAMVSVSNDTLSVELTENWFGVAEIEVSVSDGELSDTTSFELTVNSVNDAPEVFGLSSPSDSTVISITPQEISENMTLMVSWDESSDIDGDALTYGFALYNGVYGPDAPVLIDTTLSETMIQIPYPAIAQLIGSLGEMAISGDWTVYATDGVDTTMSDDVYHITLDASGVLSIDGQMLPEEFALHQNYPNPFNPTTAIRYDLPQSGDVNIMIYDIMGREIRSLVTGHQEAGFRIINWDATNDYGQAISAGMYFYVIQAGEFRETKKMVLLK